MKRIPNHKMAEGTDEDRGQRFTWNLNDVPVAINMNGRDTTRMRENLSRVVRDLLPELANQPGTPLSTRIGSAQAVVSIGTTEGGASGGLHLPGHETRGHGRHLHFDGDHVHGNGGRGREGTSSSESSTDSRNPSASLVINLGGDNLSSQLGQEQGHIHIPEPDENQNTAGSPGHTHNNGGAQPLPIRSLYRMVEGSVPFILLLFAKIMYNHRLGKNRDKWGKLIGYEKFYQLTICVILYRSILALKIIFKTHGLSDKMFRGWKELEFIGPNGNKLSRLFLV